MSKEKWEIQELVDDATAMGEHHPAMVNEYIWQMNLHGKIVHDLTAASFDQIAIQQEINTESVSREVIRDEKGITAVLTEVWVVSKNGQRRCGVCYEPAMTAKGIDKFVFAKSLTKARRNAIKQLVSASDRLQAINTLIELRDAPVKPPEPAQAVEIPLSENGAKTDEPKTDTPKESEADILRKRCFAIWQEHKESLGGDGFWDKIRERFGVKSRATMELRHWRETLSIIHEDMDAFHKKQQKENAPTNETPIRF